MIKEEVGFYIVACLFLIIIMLFLTLIEKKLRKKAHVQTIFEKHRTQIEELCKIKKFPNASESTLCKLDETFRKTIYERRKIDKMAEYSEIIDKLGSDPYIKEFSEIMIKIKYSGQKITKEKIRKLAFLLINILEHKKKT